MTIHKTAYRNLLIFLSLLYPLYPLLVLEGWIGRTIELVLGMGTLTMAVYATQGRSHNTFRALFMSLLIAVLWIIEILRPDLKWVNASRVLFFLILTLEVLWSISKHVFTAKDICTENRLYGAVCLYLFCGIFFANVFVMVNVIQPHSYSCNSVICRDDDDDKFVQAGMHLYYSFITLTTVGYGDIVPETPFAGMVAALEAIFGQMYVAIVVARLVGLHLLDSQKH